MLKIKYYYQTTSMIFPSFTLITILNTGTMNFSSFDFEQQRDGVSVKLFPTPTKKLYFSNLSTSAKLKAKINF